MLDFTLSEKETERRKQLIRDVWDYKKVDHFPVMLEVHSNPKKYTIHDEYFSKEKQLEIRLESIGKTLKYIPDDYIPLIFADVGCVGIESALGMELYYGETPNQTPGIRQYMFDGFDEIDTLKHINPYTDGILPEFLERLSYFAKETNYQLPITCLDMNGPMAIAMNIVGSENFLLGMYTEPEEVTKLLDFVMDNIILMTDACIEAVSGIGQLANTDFTWHWFPEDKKGHVSDDVSAMISTEMFQKFSIPVNSRIYQKYGPGLLHNCGPNPNVDYYLQHTPQINGADLNYQYSRNDLPAFKEPFAGKGVIYLGMGYTSDEQAINDYQYIIDSLAPKTIGIPSVIIDEGCITSKKCDPSRLYDTLRVMSEKYAKKVFGEM